MATPRGQRGRGRIVLTASQLDRLNRQQVVPGEIDRAHEEALRENERLGNLGRRQAAEERRRADEERSARVPQTKKKDGRFFPAVLILIIIALIIYLLWPEKKPVQQVVKPPETSAPAPVAPAIIQPAPVQPVPPGVTPAVSNVGIKKAKPKTVFVQVSSPTVPASAPSPTVEVHEWREPGRDPFLGAFNTREELRDKYIPNEELFVKALHEAEPSWNAEGLTKGLEIALQTGRGIRDYIVSDGTIVPWMIYDVKGKVQRNVKVVGSRPGLLISIAGRREGLIYDLHWSRACGNVIPLGTRSLPSRQAPPSVPAPAPAPAPQEKTQEVIKKEGNTINIYNINVNKNVNTNSAGGYSEPAIVVPPNGPNLGFGFYGQRRPCPPRPPMRRPPPPPRNYRGNGYGNSGSQGSGIWGYDQYFQSYGNGSR